jgi:hypothetical protein
MMDKAATGLKSHGTHRRIFCSHLYPRISFAGTRKFFPSPLARRGDGKSPLGTNNKRNLTSSTVGADGAWSKAWDALPGASKPFYSGLSYLLFTIPHLSSKYPSLASLVGNGTYHACGEHKAVISQWGVAGSTRMYLMMSIASSSFFSDSGLDTLPPAKLKKKLLS